MTSYLPTVSGPIAKGRRSLGITAKSSPLLSSVNSKGTVISTSLVPGVSRFTERVTEIPILPRAVISIEFPDSTTSEQGETPEKLREII